MTHVQTEVPEDEYERLRTVAEERGLSIREALREAAALWLREQDAVDPADPLFSSVDSVREGASGRHRSNASAEDDLVDEWQGDAEEYRLADPDYGGVRHRDRPRHAGPLSRR